MAYSQKATKRFSSITIVIVLSIIISIIAYGKKSNYEDSILVERIEGLTDSEGNYYYCRCHSSDGTCQPGNAISFRPSCGLVMSPTPISDSVCQELNENC